jgi:hypothetical protein
VTKGNAMAQAVITHHEKRRAEDVCLTSAKNIHFSDNTTKRQIDFS